MMARSGPCRANGADSQKRGLAETGGQPVAKVSALGVFIVALPVPGLRTT